MKRYYAFALVYHALKQNQYHLKLILKTISLNIKDESRYG